MCEGRQPDVRGRSVDTSRTVCCKAVKSVYRQLVTPSLGGPPFGTDPNSAAYRPLMTSDLECMKQISLFILVWCYVEMLELSADSFHA
jgi:hypothetical protein